MRHNQTQTSTLKWFRTFFLKTFLQKNKSNILLNETTINIFILIVIIYV